FGGRRVEDLGCHSLRGSGGGPEGGGGFVDDGCAGVLGLPREVVNAAAREVADRADERDVRASVVPAWIGGAEWVGGCVTVGVGHGGVGDCVAGGELAVGWGVEAGAHVDSA